MWPPSLWSRLSLRLASWPLDQGAAREEGCREFAWAVNAWGGVQQNFGCDSVSILSRSLGPFVRLSLDVKARIYFVQWKIEQQISQGESCLSINSE